MTYPFPGLFAIDPSNVSNVAVNAELTIFDPSDTAHQPIPLVDSEGLYLANPLITNDNGFIGAFYAELDEVGWTAGGLVGYAQSFRGVKNDAESAALSAGASADDAAAAREAALAAANMVGAPAGDVVRTVVNTDMASPGSAMATVLSAAIDGQVEGKFIGSAVPLDQFDRAYSKRILHSLPFRFPEFAAASTLWGSDLYPQAFQVDETASELFVVYAGTAHQVVAVYDWSTGSYKSCFAIDSAYVSEGAEVLYESGTRYLYLRSTVDGLGKFDITTLPATLTVVAAASVVATKQGINFTHRAGRWTVTDETKVKAIHGSRGLFKTLDASFAETGSVIFPELMLGGNSYKYRDNSVPKMQGICDGGGYYAVAIGGFQGRSLPVTPYGLQGIRIFSESGVLLVDSLIDPIRMMQILDTTGHTTPTRVESEGVQLVGGKLVSLTLTQSYGPGAADVEGMVFFEEFSSHPDAIDFSSAATGWSVPDVDRLQAGGFPLTLDGKMHNPIDGTVMDTIAKIVDYMKSVNQTFFAWYSSTVTVQDLNGTNVPSSTWVTIVNANNGTLFLTYTGGPQNGATYQVYTSGGNLVQAYLNPVVRGDDNATFYKIRVNTSGAVVAVAV